MRLTAPPLHGRIERRILLDCSVDPDVAARQLPPGFAPRLLDGAAVVGVCLIRLADLRPPGAPAALGRTVTAAAHRISVVGPDGEPGVVVPRRDTTSRAAVVAGGRVWPGVHHRAAITWAEDDSVTVAAADGTRVAVAVADHGTHLPDPDAVSTFHAAGVVAWSPGRTERLEVATLGCGTWRARPVGVARASSSWLADPVAFPAGSATLAGALLMEDVPVVWSGGPGRRG